MSDKFDRFEEELKALCIKHQITLYETYDGVEAADAEAGSTECYGIYIRDNTIEDTE